MSPAAVRLAIMAVAAALVFAAGWFANGWRKDAEIARLERAHATERTRDAEAAAEEMAAAVQRGNTLAARAATAESARDTALQEKNDALRRVTTGRPCLSGPAVRLLNEPAGLRPVPEPAGQPAGADAAVATDTDVALWAAYARRSYDTCRGRIDALREFFEGAP